MTRTGYHNVGGGLSDSLASSWRTPDRPVWSCPAHTSPCRRPGPTGSTWCTSHTLRGLCRTQRSASHVLTTQHKIRMRKIFLLTGRGGDVLCYSWGGRGHREDTCHTPHTTPCSPDTWGRSRRPLSSASHPLTGQPAVTSQS